MSLQKPVLPLELTGLTPITKLFPSTPPGLMMNVGQLGQSRHLNTCLHRQSLILTDSGHLSRTLITLNPKNCYTLPSLDESKLETSTN